MDIEQCIHEWTLGHKKKSKGNFKRTPKINQDYNITYQDLCDTSTTVLREKFIAISAYIKKLEMHQVNDASRT